MRHGYLGAPLVLIVVMLILGYSIVLVALVTSLGVLLLSYTSRATRLTPSRIGEALEAAGRSTCSLSATCACAGLIIGAIFSTGLSVQVTQSVLGLAQNSLWLILLISAVIALILGTGLTASAVYITMVATVVPLLKAAGVPTMGAHMFAFYYGVVSDITPPTALAAVAAAGLARANPMSTMIEASRIGITAYLVPIAFVAQPALLMQRERRRDPARHRDDGGRTDRARGRADRACAGAVGCLAAARAVRRRLPAARADRACRPPTPPGSCWRPWYSCRRCLAATRSRCRIRTASWRSASRPPVRSGCRHSCRPGWRAGWRAKSRASAEGVTEADFVRNDASVAALIGDAEGRAAARGAGADRHPLLGSLGRAGAGHAGDRDAGRALTARDQSDPLARRPAGAGIGARRRARAHLAGVRARAWQCRR